MENERSLANTVRSRRLARGWSQAELSERAEISRAAVSAIEGQRLVPSVAAALSLARVLECTVEELFGAPVSEPIRAGWAWPPPRAAWRYWQAEVGGRTLYYPVESAGTTSSMPHDGFGEESSLSLDQPALARQTLVVACCDPAAGLLSTLYHQATGLRMIAIPRSSQRALDLLSQGLVHVAGLHLSSETSDRNLHVVRAKLGEGYKLLQVATWEEGLAYHGDQTISSIRSAAQSRLRWIGREAGSGSRQCMDELLPKRISVRRIAHDHRGVAEAIRSGWADVGVCLRLTCEEAGLRFLSLRDEQYELCFARKFESDPRIQALVRVVRSEEYRRLLASLPGYGTSQSGAVRCAT